MHSDCAVSMSIYEDGDKAPEPEGGLVVPDYDTGAKADLTMSSDGGGGGGKDYAVTANKSSKNILIGVLAIAGCPLFLGLHFSGYHSKDAIVASALAFSEKNPGHFLLFALPLITAGITSFYMFRLWFMTFWGKPRDQHVYDHAHESPWIMCVPLLILAPFAWLCAYGGDQGDLYVMLTKDAPAHIENLSLIHI